MAERKISEAGPITHGVDIKTHISSRELTLYIVTADEMDTYADLGFVADIFLALFGVATGAAIGLWVAVAQGGLAPVNNAALSTAMWASAVFALVTLAFTVFFCWRRRKCKREWFNSQT